MTDEEFLKFCGQKNNVGYDALKEHLDNKGKFKLIKGKNNTSPLHIAARNKNNLIIGLLLENGFNPLVVDDTKKRKTAIVDAIEVNNIEGTLLILDKVSKPLGVKGRYSEYSALIDGTLISDTDFEQILKILLDKGFNTDILDSTKQNILTRAVIQDNLNKVKICVQCGIDINNKYIHTLNHAFLTPKRNIEIIKFLLENGANIYQESENSWESYNALEWAHSIDSEELFELLLVKYDALKYLTDDMLTDIIKYKEIKYLKHLWEIQLVHDFIIKNNLEDAFPSNIKDVFIF